MHSHLTKPVAERLSIFVDRLTTQPRRLVTFQRRLEQRPRSRIIKTVFRDQFVRHCALDRLQVRRRFQFLKWLGLFQRLSYSFSVREINRALFGRGKSSDWTCPPGQARPPKRVVTLCRPPPTKRQVGRLRAARARL